jgi:hypothetical protein
VLRSMTHQSSILAFWLWPGGKLSAHRAVGLRPSQIVILSIVLFAVHIWGSFSVFCQDLAESLKGMYYRAPSSVEALRFIGLGRHLPM